MPKVESNEVAVIATALLHATLSKAVNGGVKLHEADACARLMTAYRDWSEASKRDELVERSREIKELAQMLGAQGERVIAAAKVTRRRRTPAK